MNNTPLRPLRPGELGKMSVEQLLERLASLLNSAAQNLIDMANTVRELENKGHDLATLKCNLLPLLRLIGNGQIASEAIVRFSNNLPLLKLVSHLPLPDQIRLGQGELIDVAVVEHGKRDVIKMDPLYMPYAQLRRIMEDGKIRSPGEQVTVLMTTPKPVKKPVAKCIADRATGEIVIGKVRIAVGEVRLALEPFSKLTLAPIDAADTASVKVPKELLAAWKVAALERQCSVAEFVWRMTKVSGFC